MKHFHMPISVANFLESIRFYSGLFAGEPTKLKSDYAKRKRADPRINFDIPVASAQNELTFSCCAPVASATENRPAGRLGEGNV